jgi:hypothetical protein
VAAAINNPKSLSEVKRALTGMLQAHAAKSNLGCDLVCTFSTDCIQLVLVNSKNQKFVHPSFITRHEIENGLIEEDLLLYRFSTCAAGRPRRFPDEPAPPTFTLDEIISAQEFIDSLT